MHLRRQLSQLHHGFLERVYFRVGVEGAEGGLHLLVVVAEGFVVLSELLFVGVVLDGEVVEEGLGLVALRLGGLHLTAEVGDLGLELGYLEPEWGVPKCTKSQKEVYSVQQ